MCIIQLVTTQSTIVILTGAELRHDYFRIVLSLSPRLRVLASFREQKQSLLETVSTQVGPHSAIRIHAEERQRSEEDFFGNFIRLTPDRSSPLTIERGALNDDLRFRERIRHLNPDVLVCYGTSIIREPLLSDFAGRFLNIHLGLSPYYRGGGTNFWPLANGEPEFIGATFMQIDAGVDTGDIVHQIRALMFPEDSIHSIGNRLIAKVALTTPAVASHLQNLRRVKQAEIDLCGIDARLYRRKDFTDTALSQAKSNISNGIIADYLEAKERRDARVPIVQAAIDLS